MNCKRGDMAMVIGGVKSTQIGKTCTCIRLLAWDEHHIEERWGPIWLVDVPMSYTTPLGQVWNNYAPDQLLMPINPRNDESVESEEALSVE